MTQHDFDTWIGIGTLCVTLASLLMLLDRGRWDL